MVTKIWRQKDGIVMRSKKRGFTIGLLGLAAAFIVVAGCAPLGLVPEAKKPKARYHVEPEFKTFTLAEVPVKWDDIKPTTVTLFYPAQASWHYLTEPQPGFTHPGADAIKAGMSCRTCHRAGGAAPDEKALGQALVNSKRIEGQPIAGKRPFVDLKVKAAYDATDIYFWLQWESEEPGVYHNVLKFDGKTGKWEGFGGAKPDKSPGLYEDRLTFMIGHKKGSPGYVTAHADTKVGFQEVGCFLTCHNSMRKMPYDASGNVKAIQQVFPKEIEITKYLLVTRKSGQAGDPKELKGITEAEGQWALVRSDTELKGLRESQKFLDMWMWRAARSGPIGYADDFIVFVSRAGDKGKGPWERQRAKDLNEAKEHTRMYNPQVVSSGRLAGGTYAIKGGADPLDALKRQETISFMTSEKDYVIPYDPKVYKPQDGDILFDRILRKPTESRGDIQAFGLFHKEPGEAYGTWTLILKRRLNTGNPGDDIALKDGEVYPIAFAIHDDHVSNRRHHVSLEHTIGLGVPADIVAQKVKK